MNPVRLIHGEWGPMLIGVLVVAIVVLIVAGWARAREKRGEWGPGLMRLPQAEGYLPADLRTGPAEKIADEHERWLLGLAAPFVEQAGLLHERWSLVPAFCGDDWRRRLAAIASGWGTVRASAWKARVQNVEARLASTDSADGRPDERPWLIAELAMILRLGVAVRHTSASSARRKLNAAAAPLRASHADWFSYGDAFVRASEVFAPARNTELRADVRTLYAADGPWSEPAWPRETA